MKKARQLCKCKVCKKFSTQAQRKVAKKIKSRAERRFFKDLIRRDWDSIPTRTNKKFFTCDYIV